MVAVKLESVVKDYHLDKISVRALNGVSLQVEEGDIVCLMGPSGSGKSTLLNIMGAIDVPTSGKVLIKGTDISSLSDRKLSEFRNRTMGFIFQAFNLIPVFSVSENVEYPLLLQKVSKTDRAKRVADILQSVGLESYAHRRPDELSGGQRQRVAIARALITKPAFIVADEPTASLDHKTGKGIMELMAEMNKQMGTTIIFATHDPMVSEYARSIIRVLDGDIV